MIVVIGEFRLPANALEQARPLMADVVLASRAEPGCLSYAYAEDVTDPGIVRASETWESREALAAHFRTPHMLRWQEQRAALGMTGRRVVAYEATSIEDL